jgi:ABC-type uncharacterized transport system permease subunit
MTSQALLLLTLALYTVVAVHVLLRALGRHRALSRWVRALAVSGFALHTASLAARWAEAGHFPAVGLRDLAVFLAWMAVAVYFLIDVAARIEALSLPAFPAALALLLVAVLSAPAERTDPVLKGTYLPVHATMALFGFGALFVAAAMGALYLIQERELKRRTPRRFYYLAPSLERCETLGGRSVAVGLTFLSLAIVTGLLWSHTARGSYFSGNAKEWTAIAAWVTYLGLIVARQRSGWGGRRAAWLGLLGFVAVLFIFVWLSFVRSGGMI